MARKTVSAKKTRKGVSAKRKKKAAPAKRIAARGKASRVASGILSQMALPYTSGPGVTVTWIPQAVSTIS